MELAYARALTHGARLLDTSIDELVILVHHDFTEPRWPWTARLGTPVDAADGSRTWSPHHVFAPAETPGSAVEKLERMLRGRVGG
jgi:hypothetical protein